MNWVDAVIVFLIITAAFRGWRAGLIELTLTFAGFISGLVLGSWLISQILPNFSNQLAKVFTISLTELVLALLMTEAGRRAAQKIKPKAIRWKLGGLNDSAGS